MKRKRQEKNVPTHQVLPCATAVSTRYRLTFGYNQPYPSVTRHHTPSIHLPENSTSTTTNFSGHGTGGEWRKGDRLCGVSRGVRSILHSLCVHPALPGLYREIDARNETPAAHCRPCLYIPSTRPYATTAARCMYLCFGHICCTFCGQFLPCFGPCTAAYRSACRILVSFTHMLPTYLQSAFVVYLCSTR